MNNQVLITTSTFAKVSKEPEELLVKAGFEFSTNPFGRALKKEEVIEMARNCVGVVAGTETWDDEVISSCPNLKVISRVGVGMDNVDISFAEEKGIIVKNTPYGPTRAVAELTLALTMSLLRKVPQSHLNMKNGVWKKETGSLLSGKNVGIVGLGKIGKESASIFRSLGNTVYAYDLHFDKTWAEENQVKFLEINDLLKSSDIIILHLPGSRDKKPAITANEINQMKKGAYLINVSRGGVVEEKPLYEALKSGLLTGAAIDVFTEEPYQNGPFQELENVVLTPHIGSYAAESKLQMEIDAVNNLLEVLK